MWKDAKFGMLSRDARLLFIAAISKAECCGVVVWTPMQLMANIFPFDTDLNIEQASALMTEIEDLGMVMPYMGREGGLTYGLITNFHKHQVLRNPGVAQCPVPPDGWPSEYVSKLDSKSLEALRRWESKSKGSVWCEVSPLSDHSQVSDSPLKSKEKREKRKDQTVSLPLLSDEAVENCKPVENSGWLSQSLDKFWVAYPKKVNLNAVKNIWLMLSPTHEEFEAIMKALESDKRSELWNRDGMRHIPRPNIWLEQWIKDNKPC
jgi:hypothetical protein